MTIWSVNKIMRAVNEWRRSQSIEAVALTIGCLADEVTEHMPEMRRYGLEKVENDRKHI